MLSATPLARAPCIAQYRLRLSHIPTNDSKTVMTKFEPCVTKRLTCNIKKMNRGSVHPKSAFYKVS